MNATTLFLTTMALGVMIGITGTHYQQVNTMVNQGQGIPSQSDQPQYTIPADEMEEAPPVILASSDVPPTPQAPVATSRVVGHSMSRANDAPREDALLEILAEMRSEQRRMRLQLAETNRDLAEANFRLDTHSDSFKPLRTDVERPRALDTSGTPVDEGLLPPKP